MMSYQTAVLEEMEVVAEEFGLPVVVTFAYSNTGTIIAGTPFGIAARAAFDFQDDRTKIQFNGEPLGPSDMSWLWPHHDTEKASRMLQKWRDLIRSGIGD